jgi:hypothetical protein
LVSKADSFVASVVERLVDGVPPAAKGNVNIVGKGLGRLAERLLVYDFSKKHAEVLRKERR